MIPVEIPGYAVKGVLGRGGMATVYLAIHEKSGRDVALKVMAPALSADAGFRERFLREARIVAGISHPNIATVYDVGAAGDTYYIAMEYHPGGDLKSRLRSGVGVAEALRIARDVACALDYAHGRGYLHRDVKPDNILFRADGSAVLTDFGVARAMETDAGLTQAGVVAGTPGYMSPEQARGQVLDADSDLYSLGVVLFEMLAGHLPYEAPDPIALGILHMNAPIPKLERRLAHFQPLLDRLLAKQAARRPQSGAQLVREIDALERSYDAGPVLDDPDHERTPGRPAPRRRPALADTAPVTLPGPLAAAGARRRTAVLLFTVLCTGAGSISWHMHGKLAAAAPATTVADKVADELAAARAALARHALVSSAGDDALTHYRRVLALMPANADALAGVRQVAAGLQVQAHAALAAHRLQEAERLLASASEVLPQSPGLPALQRAIAAARVADRKEAIARMRRAAMR